METKDDDLDDELKNCEDNDLDDKLMNERAEEIYNFFIDKNWKIKPICALLGNMQIEAARLDPQQENIAGDAYGLVQWHPKSKLTNWCEKNKITNYGTIDVQCKKIQSEVDNNDKQFRPSKEFPTFLSFTQSYEGVEYLAQIFYKQYERGRSSSSIKARACKATKWYKYFK